MTVTQVYFYMNTWKEFWNVYLLMTEFDHLEVNMNTWKGEHEDMERVLKCVFTYERVLSFGGDPVKLTGR